MATAEKHHYQYSSNREFLNTMLNLETKYNDWIVTTAFYTALHLVDKTIVQGSISLQPTCHKSRNELVEKISSFTTLREEYLFMYWQSRKARYDCKPIKDKTVDAVMSKLEKMERQLARVTVES